MLGRYQRSIGEYLHISAYNILAEATPQEMQQAFVLAQQSEDDYALIGFGAYVPVEQHRTIIEGGDEPAQPRVSRALGYGAMLTQ